MKELELFLIEKGENCTVYTLQFLRDTDNEFEKFTSKFINSEDYSEDYTFIAGLIKRIFESGAAERYFRREGTISDSVAALPAKENNKLRLYCLRLSDKILILGNGGVKDTKTYQENNELMGYVMTLQKFESLLKEGVENGTVIITENEIETDNIFEI